MSDNPRLVKVIKFLLEYAEVNTPLPVYSEIEISIDHTAETRILVKRGGTTQFELVDDNGQWLVNTTDAVRERLEEFGLRASVYASATLRRYFHRPKPATTPDNSDSD